MNITEKKATKSSTATKGRPRKITQKSLPLERLVENEVNEQERIFCVNYLKSFNVENAARHAGFSTAESMHEGYKMLSKENVRNYLDYLKKHRHNAILADGAAVLQKYLDIAFADIFDFVKLGSMPISATSIENTPTGIFIKSSDELQLFLPDVVSGSLIAEIRQGKDGITIKLADRMKALEWLTEYFELNPSDVHRREADRRKIELAAVKLCPQDENKSVKNKSDKTDNFSQALQSSCENLWNEE